MRSRHANGRAPDRLAPLCPRGRDVGARHRGVEHLHQVRALAQRCERIEKGLKDAGSAQPPEPFPDRIPMAELHRKGAPGDVVDHWCPVDGKERSGKVRSGRSLPPKMRGVDLNLVGRYSDAHSTVKCNGQISGAEENLARGLVAEYLSGARVEFVLDPLDIGIGQNREVGTFWEVLPEEAVSVFVEAAFPRVIGLGKIG